MPHTRPLSPHLGIYRWRINMLQSTLHRLTGLFLCLGALPGGMGPGPRRPVQPPGSCLRAFAAVGSACCYWSCGRVLLLFHLCNGVQHLLRDTGRNFGPPTRALTRDPVYWSTGWVVIGVSVALTVLVWALLYGAWGQHHHERLSGSGVAAHTAEDRAPVGIVPSGVHHWWLQRLTADRVDSAVDLVSVFPAR